MVDKTFFAKNHEMIKEITLPHESKVAVKVDIDAEVERAYAKDGSQHDYDWTCIDLTIGRPWGEHITFCSIDVESLETMAQFLTEAAAEARVILKQAEDAKPTDWEQKGQV